MNCTECHDSGNSKNPLFFGGNTQARAAIIGKTVIDRVAMPPGASLSTSERADLMSCLFVENAATLSKKLIPESCLTSFPSSLKKIGGGAMPDPNGQKSGEMPVNSGSSKTLGEGSVTGGGNSVTGTVTSPAK